MKLPRIYTTGYSGKKATPGTDKAETFDGMVRVAGLLVCDIRMSNRSRVACWGGLNMQNRLGNLNASPDGRYLHIPALGNLNYKNGGEIKIANLEVGINRVIEACRETGLKPLLLCGCEDYKCCHRYVVGMAFRDHADYWGEITYWTSAVCTNLTGEWDKETN